MSARIILITRANGGLGLAISRAFLEEPGVTSVWLGTHQRDERAAQLAGTAADRCQVVKLDVTKPEAWRSTVEKIMGVHQRLDVLVNNAGGHDDGLLAQMKPESWRDIMAVNLDGTFHGCQAVLPAMISQRFGRIINIASLSALLAPPGQCNYAAAKAGIVALTQSLAKEVARIGITVNAVCPGYVESGAAETLSEEEKTAMRMRIPMRRFGRPEEVAAAVRFLAGREASYITGSVLKVDGGIL